MSTSRGNPAARQHAIMAGARPGQSTASCCRFQGVGLQRAGAGDDISGCGMEEYGFCVFPLRVDLCKLLCSQRHLVCLGVQPGLSSGWCVLCRKPQAPKPGLSFICQICLQEASGDICDSEACEPVWTACGRMSLRCGNLGNMKREEQLSTGKELMLSLGTPFGWI